MPCVEFEPLLVTPDTGLNPSPGKLLGGVSKFPTLVTEPGGADEDCEEFIEEKVLYCGGGGGSSKLGRLDAFGLRAVKLEGAAKGSGTPDIWDG
jgi:hypothetical protein